MIRVTGDDLPVEGVCERCGRGIRTCNSNAAEAFLRWHTCVRLTSEEWEARVCRAQNFQGDAGSGFALWEWAMVADLAEGMPPYLRSAIWQGVSSGKLSAVVDDPIISQFLG